MIEFPEKCIIIHKHQTLHFVVALNDSLNFFGVAIISGLCDEVDRSYVEVETCCVFFFNFYSTLISFAANMSKI